MNRKEKDATGASERGRPHELFLIIGQYVHDHNYTYLYVFVFFKFFIYVANIGELHRFSCRSTRV